VPRFSIPALFLAAVHLGAAVGLPSNGTSLTVTVGFVRQRDAPVQIVELRRPDVRSHNPLLHIVNKTDKATLNIGIEMFRGNAAGEVTYGTNSPGPCGVIHSQEHASNCPEQNERMIRPHGESWVHDTTLNSSTVVFQVPSPNCVFATARVMWVEFADGTTWRTTYAQRGEAIESLRELSAAQECALPAGMPTFGAIESIGDDPSLSDRHPDHSTVQSYTFVCSVNQHEGKVTSWCPL